MSAHRNKNNQGAERDRLFGLSGEGPKTEQEEEEGKRGIEVVEGGMVG